MKILQDAALIVHMLALKW